MKNNQGITTVQMSEDLRVFCPLGNQWYTAHITVLANNPCEMPDYLDVTNTFSSLEGQDQSIEDLVLTVFNIAKLWFGGSSLLVRADVEKGKHLPVTITKEG